MEAEAEEEEKEKSYKGIEADRLEKEGVKREIRRLIDPRKPTKEEVDEHELTHVPYRNWCPICVMAKGKESDHRNSSEGPSGMSEYSFDYCFPGDELGRKRTDLVMSRRHICSG